jgi:hypothetical protein
MGVILLVLYHQVTHKNCNKFLKQWRDFYLFSTAPRPALRPTPIQGVLGAISPAVKRPIIEADHSPPPSAEVKNAWSCNSTHKYVIMTWYLVNH